MRTDHVRYQKIDHGTVPLQSIRQASFCIFCTILSQQKHQLVDFLPHFIHATGIFSHFDKCNECLVSEELIEKQLQYYSYPFSANGLIWGNFIKEYKNSHAVYMQEKWVIRKSTKKKIVFLIPIGLCNFFLIWLASFNFPLFYPNIL